MTASFGIDHPLIAVRDIEQLRNRLISMGFTMTSIGEHPWGTSTSLAMFNGCLIEIMGIYDDRLLDEKPAGEFRFGRHIHDHLKQREGIALTALHSTDSQADMNQLLQAGFYVAGQLEFGRDVTLPDLRQDRTRTTLTLAPDLYWPRLSFFLCQQHRPDLIYVPQWLDHSNSVHGIGGITIMVAPDDMNGLKAKLSLLYGPEQHIVGGYQLESANGSISLLSRASVEDIFGQLPSDLVDEGGPCIVAMDLIYSDREALHKCLYKSGIKFTEHEGVFTLLRAELTGNTFLRFRYGVLSR